MACFHSNKSNWNLTLYVIFHSNHNSLGHMLVFHNYLLHLASRQSMTCSIDDIINSRHNVKVTFFIIKPRIPCIVISWKFFKILLDEDIITLPKTQHERWGSWELHGDQACLSRFTFLTSFSIEDFYIIARDRLTGRARLHWKSS